MSLKVRFAISVGSEGPDVRATVQRCEALGFDTVWLSDLPLGNGGDPIVTLAALAAATDGLHLGTNLVPFGRNPMVLARQLAQIDQLSGGRLLVTLVPGLGQPTERAALGLDGVDRGHALDEIVGLLRAWWSGQTVTHHSDRFHFDDVSIEPTPVQQPLELWFGGQGPRALDRVGRLGDGWLGAGLGPARAAEARRRIDDAADAAGRTVDPQHFGLSLPVGRRVLPEATAAQLSARYGDQPLEDLVPVGEDRVREMIEVLVGAGLSKFVIRLVDGGAEDDLEWLAAVLLPLQT